MGSLVLSMTSELLSEPSVTPICFFFWLRHAGCGILVLGPGIENPGRSSESAES